jgi:polyhydroxyalkanoate synthesis regulator phasin
MATTHTKTPPAAKNASRTKKAIILPIFRETYYVGLGLFDWTAEHFRSFEKELVVRGEKRHVIIAKRTKELRERIRKSVKALPEKLSERTEVLKAGVSKGTRTIKAGARRRVKELRQPVEEAAAASA